MPIFTPGRRWQPPYMPFKHEPFSGRLLIAAEKSLKSLYGVPDVR